VFTFKHFFLLNFHCVTYSALRNTLGGFHEVIGSWGESYLRHRYVIVETTSKYFCFAKGASGIEVLCSHRMKDLHDSQHQEGAEDTYDIFEKGKEPQPSTTTIKDMVSWIFTTGEIKRGYNTFTDNCKDFASRLHLHFCNPKLEAEREAERLYYSKGICLPWKFKHLI